MLNDKKLSKIEKALGKETMGELESYARRRTKGSPYCCRTFD
jgi:hypothetical protein